MKLNKFIMVAAAAAMMSLTMNSCKDECKDVDCGQGSCDEGNCTCNTGYEGENCETAQRTKFIGSFQGHEACSLGSDDYVISIGEGSNIVNITITNIYNNNPAYVVSATVSGAAFTIETTTVAPGVTVSGNGTISGSSLTLTYSISDGTLTNTCTFTGTKL